jgi:hydroxyacylglutathione hydrolase
VINSHEHCDHIGANRYFHESAMITAYRLAASKMIAGDYYVTMDKGNDLNEIPLRVHLWLENITRIDLPIKAYVFLIRRAIFPDHRD